MSDGPCSKGYCIDKNTTSQINGSFTMLEDLCKRDEFCKIFDYNHNLSFGHLCYSPDYFHYDTEGYMICRTTPGKINFITFMNSIVLPIMPCTKYIIIRNHSFD